jgi:hypothetical protein
MPVLVNGFGWDLELDPEDGIVFLSLAYRSIEYDKPILSRVDCLSLDLK